MKYLYSVLCKAVNDHGISIIPSTKLPFFPESKNAQNNRLAIACISGLDCGRAAPHGNSHRVFNAASSTANSGGTAFHLRAR